MGSRTVKPPSPPQLFFLRPCSCFVAHYTKINTYTSFGGCYDSQRRYDIAGMTGIVPYFGYLDFDNLSSKLGIIYIFFKGMISPLTNCGAPWKDRDRFL